MFADPAFFARYVLQHDLWGGQVTMLRSVKEHKRTAVKACHSSSKTFTAAELVLWWVSAWKEAIAITTGPTRNQVERQLWKEIHTAAAKSLYRFPQMNLTELRVSPECFAVGFTTDEGVRFQGFHAPHILIIYDEAMGVSPEIWEAGHSMGAGGDVRILALGNPTHAGGPFYEAFSEKADLWNLVTFDAFCTPNLRGLHPGRSDEEIQAMDDEEVVEPLLKLSDAELGRNRLPYLINRQYVKDCWLEWGPDNPKWMGRVRGRFPGSGQGALLDLAWVERALPPVVKSPELAPLASEQAGLTAGIDVAGPGEDETVLAIRDRERVIYLHGWSDADTRGKVLGALRPYADKLGRIHVDSVGIGWYFYQHLKAAFKELNPKTKVIAVNVGEKPSGERNQGQFRDRKAQYYWSLRKAFQEGGINGLAGHVAGNASGKLRAQLMTIRYDHTDQGRVFIVPKDEMVKKGIKSPDYAEAVMLCFANVETGPYIV